MCAFLRLCVLGLALTTGARALEVPPLTGPVVDKAGVLSADEAAVLADSLRDFQQRVGPQLQLLVLPSLEGDSLEEFSIRVGEKWKLGDAKRDDGVLLVVALQDRKLRIEVGNGIEGQLPDAYAARIIRENIVPYFKAGRINEGIVSGLQAIAARLGGELRNAPAVGRAGRRSSESLNRLELMLLLLFLIVMFIASRLRGRGSGFRRGAMWGAAGGWGAGSSWGGRGGGGGGSWGGGGGGFSGGGSSGSW